MYSEELQYDEVVRIIKEQLVAVMEDNYNIYKNYDVIIAKEQEFDKHTKLGLKPKTIYVVVKFGGATINFGQTVLPVTLTVMSEQNKCTIAQRLLIEYVNKYNLEINQDGTIKQVYESPSVTSNFNIVYEGYRSILIVSAFFVISKKADFFEFEYLNDKKVYIVEENIGEDVIIKSFDSQKFINKVGSEKYGEWSFVFSGGFWMLENTLEIVDLSEYGVEIDLKPGGDYTNSSTMFKIRYDEAEYTTIPTITNILSGEFFPDTQPFFNKSNFGETEIKSGILTVAFTTFLLKDIDVVINALKVGLKKFSVNNEFKMKIKFRKSLGLNLEDTFKLINFNAQQDLGDIPMISLIFSL